MMTSGNLTVFSALKEATLILSKNNTIETPRLDAEVLLCCVLKCQRIFLVINQNKILNNNETKTFFEYIERRKKNEPVSYITGIKEFMSLEFSVKPGILIPRPDTEILVEKIIELYDKKRAKIIDICTGSGAIAVSLAHYLKNAEIYALDKYEICTDTAKENAQKNNVDINVLKCDVFDKIELERNFDCVVSNPPYIENGVLKTLSSDVKDYEPGYALDGGNDGLIFYRRITEIAASILKTGGILAYEIGYNQGESVSNIISASGEFYKSEVLKDLSGLDRVVIAEKR